MYRPPKMLPTSMDYEVGGKDAKELRRSKEQRRRAGRSQLIKVRARIRSRRAHLRLSFRRGAKRLFAPRVSFHEIVRGFLIYWRKSHVPNLGQGAARFAVGEHPIKSWTFISARVDREYRLTRLSHSFSLTRRNSLAKSAKLPRRLVWETKIWSKARSRSARWQEWKLAREWRKICSRACRFPNKSDEDKKPRRETSTRSPPSATSAMTSPISSSAPTSSTKFRVNVVWWIPSRKGTKSPVKISLLENKMCRCAIRSG